MARIEVRGTSLEVRESGGGSLLVLVHGSVSDHRTWSRLHPRFARRFRTVSYSRRFHWPNDPIPPGADYDMWEHVADLADLLEVLGAGPAHLVGHSYGAYVALLLAMEEPGRVRTLVLAEPPAVPVLAGIPPRPVELLRLLVTRPAAAGALLAFGALGLAPAKRAFRRGDRERGLAVFGRAVLGRSAFRRLEPGRLAQVRDNLMAAEFLGSGFPPIDDRKVQRLPHPTLLVGAADSPSLFRHILSRLEELIPDAVREVIAGASHIVHEDRPDAFEGRVLDFLRSRGAMD